MESFVVPGGQLSFGVSVTIVSLMLIGAGSVEVSARPILPTTIFTCRICRNNAVLFDHQFRCLCERNARIGDRHPHRRLFIERRHELRSDRCGEIHREAKESRSRKQSDRAMPKGKAEHRAVDRRAEAA